MDLSLTGPQDIGIGGAETYSSIENAIGGNGSDVLAGNAGDNLLDGGAGHDTISYATSTAGVVVDLNLTTAQNTVGAGVDTLLNFEGLVGSAGALAVMSGHRMNRPAPISVFSDQRRTKSTI